MKDSRVEAALAWLRDLPERERRRVAAGPFEAQSVLILAGLDTEALMVASVARGKEAASMLRICSVCLCAQFETRSGWTCQNGHGGADEADPVGCAQRCLLINQGPCGCRVPDRVAGLRRRQRALQWACEAILRPEPVEPGKGSLKTTLGMFQRLCMADALDPELNIAPGDRMHLRETAATVRQRLGVR